MIFLPIRKLLAVLWKPALRHRRMPCSVQDCMDDAPVHRELYCRPWLIIIVTLVLLYYVYYIHIPRGYSIKSVIGELHSEVRETDDIEIIKNAGNTSCGIGCNWDVLSESKKQNTTSIFISNSSEMAFCELNMTARGPLPIHSSQYKANLKRYYPLIKLGGYHKPTKCLSRHKVAIIVPYRDREANLNVFLLHIHPFLMNQKLNYRIFVVEQSGQEEFNKGRLLNVGFQQARRFGNWQCMVFHDVDLLPIDERILYTCPTFPRHMSATVEGHDDDPKYRHFGGVTSMTDEHFRKVNGYSNMYWGVDGVESNMFWRIRLMGLRIVRYERTIAVYTVLPRPPQTKNYTKSQEWMSLDSRRAQSKDDGLSNIKYKVLSVRLRSLFTHVLVDLNPIASSMSKPSRLKAKS